MSELNRADLASAAEVDPWAQRAQLRAGDPDQIMELAAAFYRAGGDAADAAAAERRSTQYVRLGYRVRGSSPMDADAAVTATSVGLLDAEHALPAIARTLYGVADELADATRRVDTEVRALDQALVTVAAERASLSQVAGHTLSPVERQQVLDANYSDAVARVRSAGQVTTRAVFGYEHALAAANRTLAGLGFHEPAGLRDAGERRAESLPPGAVPKKVAAWWGRLTLAQQEYLIDHDYGSLGQLKGLPATVLDVSNRHRLRDDIARLVRTLAFASAGSALAVAAAKQLAEDRGILKGLAHRDSVGSAPQSYLLAYDPDAPRGQTGVVMSYGNPDDAKNVAVVVPGAQSHAGDLTTPASHGINVYDSMTSPSKAVVVWLDGPEPPTIAQAASDGFAQDSAPRLVDDLAALRVAHTQAAGGDAHVTLVGHSYGSYIVGKAMTQGAGADDVVFMGSPGVGVNHAADLHVDPQHVWDGQAGDDPINLVRNRFTPGIVFGNDPSDGDFGGLHFSVDGSHGHLQYYDPGSESMRNVGRIADGDYAQVDTVAAPDYRGPYELPIDDLAVAANPYATEYDATDDLLHGHPIDAGKDLWGGTVREVKLVGDLAGDLAHLVP